MSIHDVIDKYSKRNVQSSIEGLQEKIIDYIKDNYMDGLSSLIEVDRKFNDDIKQLLLGQIKQNEDQIAQNITNIVHEEFDLSVDQQNSLVENLKQILENHKSNQGEIFIMKKYRKFEDAWNTFAKANLTLSEGCDQIKIGKISEDSLFQYCCITSTRKDSLGFHYYLLLRHAADLQNNFLSTTIQDKQKLELMKQKEVDLMKLSGRQIIQTEISAEDAQGIIMNGNSFNCLEYGYGTYTVYDLEQIKQEFETLLLNGKTLIKLDAEVCYKYTDMENPYQQFDNILQKIKPQVQSGAIINIVEGIKEEQKIFQLFTEDISTTMNLLQQTGGNPNQPLIDYMKAFGLTSFDKEIKSEVHLKHFLHFYEVLEGSLANKMIAKTDKRFHTPISRSDLSALEKVIDDEFMSKSKVPNYEADLLHLRRALQRLCLRQFYIGNQHSNTDDPLFEYLLSEFNAYLFDVGQEPPLSRLSSIFNNEKGKLKNIKLAHAVKVLEELDKAKDEVELNKLKAEEAMKRAISQDSERQSSNSASEGDFRIFGRSQVQQVQAPPAQILPPGQRRDQGPPGGRSNAGPGGRGGARQPAGKRNIV